MTHTTKTALFFSVQWQVFFCLIFSINITAAADINLTLSTHSIDENVTVTVENSSKQAVNISAVYIELDGKKYDALTQPSIPAFSNEQFDFQVKLPKLPGSYALIATVRYFNEERLLSLKHVGIFNYQETAFSERQCFLEEGIIEGTEGKVLLKGESLDSWRLIVPDEISIVSTKTNIQEKFFYLKTEITGLNNKYPLFAIATTEHNGKHSIALCESGLFLKDYYEKQISTQRGKIPSLALIVQALLSFGLCAYLLLGKLTETRLINALGKYASRIFFISIFYYLLKNFDAWLEQSLTYITWEYYVFFAEAWISNLQGSNYQYFFNFFVDAYLLICLLLIFPYFYFFDADKPLIQDKYIAAFKTLLSILSILRTRRLYWNSLSKLGFLTMGVKLFFLPYLISWVINNTIHQTNLTNDITWDLYTINAYLVALFIYVDTVIFATGYLIESKFLKNEIKSVEPTLLGWIVCLWCYPPFNTFSFTIFDYQMIDIYRQYPQWILAIMTCIITGLWGIFAWASLSLGFKASNLTNRGIVTKGPYRFVRHPAYSAKLLIWLIQLVFFGQYMLGLFMGFVLIYFLRAWTEERHLSQDTAYLKYKSQVRRWFIPYMI